MSNYAALKAALATTYAGQTDAQIVAAVNGVTVTQIVDVSMSDVLAYFALTGALPTIKSWAASPPAVAGAVTAQAANAAQTLGLMIGPPPLFESLQLSDPIKGPAISALLSALVAAGLVSASAATAITAMSQTLASQAALWGWPGGIIENDIAAARLA